MTRILSQTLSLVGMLAIAAVIAVVARGIGTGGIGTGGVPWARVVAVLLVAVLCFWGARRVKRPEDGDG